MSDYLEYRGKCKEMAEQAVVDDPSLRIVRGFYHCHSGENRRIGGQ